MKKQSTLLVSLACILSCGILLFFSTNNPAHPAPTTGKKYRDQQQESEGNHSRREAWIELLHKAAPGTDWRSLDAAAMQELARQRPRGGNRAGELFANGQLEGEWSERGSNNQAGSMREVDYDPHSNRIFGISDGGSLWRGTLDGSGWTVLNDDIRLNPELLKLTENDTGSLRIFTASGKTLSYSDNEGQTFQNSVFSPAFYDAWGRPLQLSVLHDSLQTMYYLVHTWDAASWEPRIWLYRSVNHGKNFSRIHIFYHQNDYRISMWSPFESNETYILDRSQTLYSVSGDSVHILSQNMDLPTESDLVLTGHRSADSSLIFYALVQNTDVWRSADNGATWAMQGSTPESAWAVGMTASPFLPDLLTMGGVNCHRSTDGGATWETLNEWWEYYDNLDLLHADMMDFKAFRHSDSTPFYLIANHAGLHVSYDHFASTLNIGLQGMNISQYYDVLTNPADPAFIYAGSQDQGWQWTSTADEPGALDFEQQWSGDYGMQLLTGNYQHFWTQYPGGIMDYYHYAFSPPNPWPETEWSLTGDDLPAVGWIVPTANTADPASNSVFIAGGNINGGSGSYLITLTATTSPSFEINASQFGFDFKQASNSGEGLISAIEQSAVNPDRLYVSTSDGTFFFSNDGGNNWQKSPGFNGPTTDWLYTSCILASKIDSNLLWISGSGYSGSPLYKSTNGGLSFTSISVAAPATIIQEIVANPEETMLFAATGVGPFVYIVAENKWYPLLGEQTPLQWFTCVEYVEAEDLVRFGTMGRGIWDFKIITEPPLATKPLPAVPLVSVFPNPVSAGQSFLVKTSVAAPLFISLTDLTGKIVLEEKLAETGLVSTSNLSPGIYLYRLLSKGKNVGVGKMVIAH